MKKPPGKADPGWYDSPTLEGYFQFWDGEYWTENKIINDGLDPKTLPPATDLHLGKFLLTKPYYKDGALILIFLFNFFGVASVILESREGYIEMGGAGVLALIFDFIFIVPGMLVFWILFLVYLIPRRIFHKKKLAKLFGNT